MEENSNSQEKVVLYMHAGSGNHGCEAIVNSTCLLLGTRPFVVSARAGEDERYSLAGMCTLLEEKRITENFGTHLKCFMKRLIMRDPMCYIEYRFQELFRQSFRTAVSIGGDNYCYPEQVQDLMLLNKALKQRGSRTILWGASVEPFLLKRQDVVEDMKRYDHIFAREVVTYEALRDAGIERDRLHFYPDPAFCLKIREAPLPEGFEPQNTVGINLSPMAIDRESVPGMAMNNYRTLIRRIIDRTQMQVALLPHVVWDSNDDRKVLRVLLEEFRESGRVFLLPDADCMTLKGYIARMRFLVAARTHASIAAYSAGVPSLVVGYSVKARGIAEDLFGTQEHFVLPVQEMSGEEDLSKAFFWLYEREGQIRKVLTDEMPRYLERVREGGELLRKIVSE